MDNFLRPLAAINLPKSFHILGNICKGVKISYFSREIIVGELLKSFGDFFLVTLFVMDICLQNSVPVFAPELSDTMGIIEWGECLPDCPQEAVDKVCIMEPVFPEFSDGTPGTANFTSNYRLGSGLPTLDVCSIWSQNCSINFLSKLKAAI